MYKITLKIILISSLLLNSAGPIYALRPMAEGLSSHEIPALEDIAQLFEEKAPYLLKELKSGITSICLLPNNATCAYSLSGDKFFLHPDLIIPSYTKPSERSKMLQLAFLLIFRIVLKKYVDKFLENKGRIDRKKDVSDILTDIFTSSWLSQDTAFHWNLRLSLNSEPQNMAKNHLSNIFAPALKLSEAELTYANTIEARIRYIASLKDIPMSEHEVIAAGELYEDLLQDIYNEIFFIFLTSLRSPSSEISKKMRDGVIGILSSLVFSEPMRVDVYSLCDLAKKRADTPGEKRQLQILGSAIELLLSANLTRIGYLSQLKSSQPGDGEDYFLINRILKENLDAHFRLFLQGLPFKGVHIIFSGSLARGNSIIGSDHDFYIVLDDTTSISDKEKEYIIEVLQRSSFKVHQEGMPKADSSALEPFISHGDYFIKRSELLAELNSVRAAALGIVKKYSILDSWVISMDSGFVDEFQAARTAFLAYNARGLAEKAVSRLRSEALSSSSTNLDNINFKDSPLTTMTLNHIIAALRTMYNNTAYSTEYDADEFLASLSGSSVIGEDDKNKLMNAYSFFGMSRLYQLGYFRLELKQGSEPRIEGPCWDFVAEKMGYKSADEFKNEIVLTRAWIHDFILKFFPETDGSEASGENDKVLQKYSSSGEITPGKVSSPSDRLRQIISKHLPDNKLTILFVCTNNHNRSTSMHLIAKDFLIEHGLSKKIVITSAGTYERDVIAPLPHKGMEMMTAIYRVLYMDDYKAAGISGSTAEAFEPSALSKEQIESADIIITAEEENKNLVMGSVPESRDKVFKFNELLTQEDKNFGKDLPDDEAAFYYIRDVLNRTLFPLLFEFGTKSSSIGEKIDDSQLSEPAKLVRKETLELWAEVEPHIKRSKDLINEIPSCQALSPYEKNELFAYIFNELNIIIRVLEIRREGLRERSVGAEGLNIRVLLKAIADTFVHFTGNATGLLKVTLQLLEEGKIKDSKMIQLRDTLDALESYLFDMTRIDEVYLKIDGVSDICYILYIPRRVDAHPYHMVSFDKPIQTREDFAERCGYVIPPFTYPKSPLMPKTTLTALDSAALRPMATKVASVTVPGPESFVVTGTKDIVHTYHAGEEKEFHLADGSKVFSRVLSTRFAALNKSNRISDSEKTIVISDGGIIATNSGYKLTTGEYVLYGCILVIIQAFVDNKPCAYAAVHLSRFSDVKAIGTKAISEDHLIQKAVCYLKSLVGDSPSLNYKAMVIGKDEKRFVGEGKDDLAIVKRGLTDIWHIDVPDSCYYSGKPSSNFVHVSYDGSSEAVVKSFSDTRSPAGPGVYLGNFDRDKRYVLDGTYNLAWSPEAPKSSSSGESSIESKAFYKAVYGRYGKDGIPVYRNNVPGKRKGQIALLACEISEFTPIMRKAAARSLGIYLRSSKNPPAHPKVIGKLLDYLRGKIDIGDILEYGAGFETKRIYLALSYPWQNGKNRIEVEALILALEESDVNILTVWEIRQNNDDDKLKEKIREMQDALKRKQRKPILISKLKKEIEELRRKSKARFVGAGRQLLRYAIYRELNYIKKGLDLDIAALYELEKEGLVMTGPELKEHLFTRPQFDRYIKRKIKTTIRILQAAEQEGDRGAGRILSRIEFAKSSSSGEKHEDNLGTWHPEKLNDEIEMIVNSMHILSLHPDLTKGAIERRLEFIASLPNSRKGVSLWLAAGDTCYGVGDSPLIAADALYGIDTIATNKDTRALSTLADYKRGIALRLFLAKLKAQRLREGDDTYRRAGDWIDKKLKIEKLDIKRLDKYLGTKRVRHISLLSLFNDFGGTPLSMSVVHPEGRIFIKKFIYKILNHLEVGGTLTYSQHMHSILEAACKEYGYELGDVYSLGKVSQDIAYMIVLKKRSQQPKSRLPNRNSAKSSSSGEIESLEKALSKCVGFARTLSSKEPFFLSGVPDNIAKAYLEKFRQRQEEMIGSNMKVVVMSFAELVKGISLAFDWEDEGYNVFCIYGYRPYITGEYTTEEALSALDALRGIQQTHEGLEAGIILLASEEFDESHFTGKQKSEISYPLGNFPKFFHYDGREITGYLPRFDSTEPLKFSASATDAAIDSAA